MASLFDDEEELFEGYTLNDVYNAFSFAETGGESNPWIRTRVSKAPGSSAYGPVQMNANLVDNVYKNKRDIYDAHSDWAQNLRARQALSLHYGKEPQKVGYDPMWEYGETGPNLTNIQKMQYENFAKDIMYDMWQESKSRKNPVKDFIERWRRATEDEDPDYYKRFNTSLGR